MAGREGMGPLGSGPVELIKSAETAPLLLQVEVIGTNYTFSSSEQMQVMLLLNQLSVNLTKGERVTLRAFAVNSVGTSDPVSANVIVPCELLTVYDMHGPSHVKCSAFQW